MTDNEKTIKKLMEFQKIEDDIRKASVELSKNSDRATYKKIKEDCNAKKEELDQLLEEFGKVIDRINELVVNQTKFKDGLKKHFIDEDITTMKKKDLDLFIKKIEKTEEVARSGITQIQTKQDQFNAIISQYDKIKEEYNKKIKILADLKEKISQTEEKKKAEIESLTAKLGEISKTLSGDVYNEYKKVANNKLFPRMIPAKNGGYR